MAVPMLQLGVGGLTVSRNAAHDNPIQDGSAGPCGPCDGEQLRLRLPRKNSTPSPADGIPVKQPRPRPLEQELVPLQSLIKEYSFPLLLNPTHSTGGSDTGQKDPCWGG